MHWKADGKSCVLTRNCILVAPLVHDGRQFATCPLLSGNVNISAELFVSWIDDNYQRYYDEYTFAGNTLVFPAVCNETLDKEQTPLVKCHNYSSSSNGEGGEKCSLVFPWYFISLHVGWHMQYCQEEKFSKHNKVSWNEASNMCKSAGGFLPIFRSLEELEEFVALLKLTPYKTTFVRTGHKMIMELSNHGKVLLSALHFPSKVDIAKFGRRSIPPSPENYQTVFIGLTRNPERKVRPHFLGSLSSAHHSCFVFSTKQIFKRRRKCFRIWLHKAFPLS